MFWNKWDYWNRWKHRLWRNALLEEIRVPYVKKEIEDIYRDKPFYKSNVDSHWGVQNKRIQQIQKAELMGAIKNKIYFSVTFDW